jgi:hypothetical protein
MNSDNALQVPEEDPVIQFSFKVDEKLAIKIDKHLHLLRYLNHNKKSKQQWLNEALVEKAANEKGVLPDILTKEKQLTVRIDAPLNKKIQKKVDLIKSFKSGFTKKSWVIEAIEQKLKCEEESTKKALSEMS